MTYSLETRIERFKLGKKIVNDMVEDILLLEKNQKPHYGVEIHETRVDGLNPEKDLWELLGYFYGLANNIVKHPKIMYNALKKKETDNF